MKNEAEKIDNQQGNGVLPCVSVSLHELKLIRTIANEVYHDLVSSNRPTHDEWSSSSVNLKQIIKLIDKAVSNER